MGISDWEDEQYGLNAGWRPMYPTGKMLGLHGVTYGLPLYFSNKKEIIDCAFYIKHINYFYRQNCSVKVNIFCEWTNSSEQFFNDAMPLQSSAPSILYPRRVCAFKLDALTMTQCKRR